MKKVPAILTAGILCLSLLSACGASGTNNTPTAKSGAYLGDFDVSEYVTLGEYKDMEVTVTRTVTEEEIDSYMESALTSALQPSDSDKPLEEGDIFNADYSGRLKETDEVFEGGTAENQQFTLGAGGYVDGFEDGFYGMVPGEVKEVELTFPEEYSEELAGKDVIFTFTFNHHLEPAESWTDEVVKTIGLDGVETVEELREYTREMLQDSKDGNLSAEAQSKVLQQVEDNCTFSDPPAEMVERFTTQLWANAESMAEQYSAMGSEIDVEEMLSSQLTYYGFSGTVDEMVAEYSDRFSKMLVMYYAIAQAEGITVPESEIEETLTSTMESYGYETVEEMNEGLHTDMRKEVYEAQLMDKVQEFLLKNNTAVDENGEPVALVEEFTEGGVGSDGSIGGE